MSTRSPRPRPRSIRRTGVPVLGLVAAALSSAAPVGAATPRFSTIVQPLTAGTAGQTAAGDGRVAWVVPDGVERDGSVIAETVWTVRDGVPTRVGTTPDGTVEHIGVIGSGPPGALRTEVGTNVAGAGVAVFTTLDYSAIPKVDVRLVKLDGGETQMLTANRRGLQVGGVALDHGQLYFTLHVRKVGARNTSALWRAPLNGLRTGTATRVRTSRRGETWGDVVADRGRVAVRTSRTVRSGGRPGRLEQIAFGTPQGAWNRTGDVLVREGPVDLVSIAGFTQDGSSIVTLRAPEGGPLRATRTPIAPTRPGSSALLGTTRADSLTAVSFVPATGRFLGVGKDAAGATSVGFTAPVFAPAAAAGR